MNKSLLKNKRADFIGLNVLLHILEIVFIISVSIFVLFIVHVDKEIDTFPVESEILLNRILYSNNGLWSYDDKINRLYPGIIEFKEFNNKEKMEESLAKSLYYGTENERAAALLTFVEGDKEIGTVYYNEEKYNEWIPRYKGGWTEGAGGWQARNKKINVLIKKEEGLTPGTIDITVIIPNR